MKKSILVISALLFCFALFGQKNWNVIKVPDPNHPAQSIECPMVGSAKNVTSKEGHLAWIGNPAKNRWDFPDSSQMGILKIENLIAMDAIKTKFTPGEAAQVVAYVYDVKTGGVESCNCDTKAIEFRDTHITLTPGPNETSEQFRMIVEVTPRARMIMAEKGLDWSTNNLKNELQGHMVLIEGWLFYDEIHEPQAFSTNPINKGGINWRASCWEIHPVTRIVIADSATHKTSLTSQEQAKENTGSNEESNHLSPLSTKTPKDIFFTIVIGAVLGMVGQGIRMIVGLKKLYDSTQSRKYFYEMFSSKKLFLSLTLALTIGLIAGALMAIYEIDTAWNRSTILATIGAGYAGVDFIEGMLGNKMPGSKG